MRYLFLAAFAVLLLLGCDDGAKRGFSGLNEAPTSGQGNVTDNNQRSVTDNNQRSVTNNNQAELECTAPTVFTDSPVSFTRYDIVSGLSYSYGFSVYDYDRDGRQDVSFFDSWVYSRTYFRAQPGADGYIMWSSGQKEKIVANEDFSFSASATTHVYLYERHMPMDINADGWMDIVGVVNSHGSVLAYLNPGLQNAPWQPRVISTNTPAAVNLDKADIDGDGDEDLFVSMRYQPTTSSPGMRSGIAWLENPSAAGEWVYHEIDTSDDFFYDTRTVQAGDIDLDGSIDVLVSDSGTGNLAWYGFGSGVWTRHVIEGLNVKQAHFGRLFDFDRDGLLDVVMPHRFGIAWFKNQDKGEAWQSNDIVDLGVAWSQFITEVAIGDVDLDGTDDIVFSHGAFNAGENHPGGVSWLSFDGVKWNLYSLYRDEYNRSVGMQLIDFDGDGDLDIISNTEYHTNGLSLWVNNR